MINKHYATAIGPIINYFRGAYKEDYIEFVFSRARNNIDAMLELASG
jgi:hypothetical protein